MASSYSPLPSFLGGLSSVSLSPPSSSLIPVKEDGEFRNWAELPSELTSSILTRLGSIDILENAQKVCTSWHGVCKDPAIWRKIDMHNLRNLNEDLENMYRHENMCRRAVDRSQGGLVEIDIWHFGTNDLLHYIADSSSILRSLKLVSCYPITSEGLTEALVKLPLLEFLEVSYCSLSGESLVVVGQSCPNLKTLKLNRYLHFYLSFESDDDALAIAETMHGLRHLQLSGNRLTNYGLNAILDNCPNLEHLDLRECDNIIFVEDLEKRCSERIKVLRRPYDSIHYHPYDLMMNINMDSFEDDCSYDFEGASDHSDW